VPMDTCPNCGFNQVPGEELNCPKCFARVRASVADDEDTAPSTGRVVRLLKTPLGALGVLALAWLGMMAYAQLTTGEPAGVSSTRSARPAPSAADEEAAQRFDRNEFAKELRAAEDLVVRRQWDQVQPALVPLRIKLNAVNRSSIANRSDIVEMRNRLERLGKQLDRHVELLQLEKSAVEARALYADFKANEVRANSIWKGRTIAVKGRVDRIATDILGAPYVSLETGELIGSVQAMFPRSSADSLVNINVGQTLVLECRVDGLLMNVILRDCRRP
jgi:hypothetical protein